MIWHTDYNTIGLFPTAEFQFIADVTHQKTQAT